MINEIPVLFGPQSSLVGVVCQPSAERAVGDLACLTFNAGVIHRIGPHRFNVKLSRALAQQGTLSMRFDLGGLGDSRPSGLQQGYVKQAIADIRAAMDYLERYHGIRRFALIGNCSGAVHIYWAAQEDERIAGILMFDGFWYRTLWSLPARHLTRLRAIGWLGTIKAVGRRLARVLWLSKSAVREEPASLVPTDELSVNPPRADYCRAMQALVDRGTKVFVVFSGGAVDYYSYKNQFRDAFGREPFFAGVRCDFLPQIDHTLLSLESQQLLINVIRDWIPSMLSSTAPVTTKSTSANRPDVECRGSSENVGNRL